MGEHQGRNEHDVSTNRWDDPKNARCWKNRLIGYRLGLIV